MGIIHMNGRVYDPLIGRMMSADSGIANPYSLQSFNRYSYVLNNPLHFRDPTGYEPWGSNSDGNTQSNYGSDGHAYNTYTGQQYESSSTNSSSGSSYRPGDAVSARDVSPGYTFSTPIANPGYSNGQFSWSPINHLEITNRGQYGGAWTGSGIMDNRRLFYGEGVRPTATSPIRYVFIKGDEIERVCVECNFIPFKLLRTLWGLASNLRNQKDDRGGLPDSALVCRGGECGADNFINGKGVTQDAQGKLSGVSTQSAAEESLTVLTKPFKNEQVGVTTAGEIRQAGGTVTRDGSTANPNHATVDGLTGQQLENLFTPTIRNPVPRSLRGY
jgi:hypothetical protein